MALLGLERTAQLGELKHPAGIRPLGSQELLDGVAGSGRGGCDAGDGSSAALNDECLAVVLHPVEKVREASSRLRCREPPHTDIRLSGPVTASAQPGLRPPSRSRCARSAADHVLALREANGGDRVDVILEMTGGDVFSRSLAALTPFGRLVHLGQAARGGTPDVNPGELLGRSQGVLGSWPVHVMRRPELMSGAMDDLFAAVQSGGLEVVAGGTYPLEDARRAHEDLRARKTTGKLMLET